MIYSVEFNGRKYEFDVTSIFGEGKIPSYHTFYSAVSELMSKSISAYGYVDTERIISVIKNNVYHMQYSYLVNELGVGGDFGNWFNGIKTSYDEMTGGMKTSKFDVVCNDYCTELTLEDAIDYLKRGRTIEVRIYDEKNRIRYWEKYNAGCDPSECLSLKELTTGRFFLVIDEGV